jgi:hypothetical protein
MLKWNRQLSRLASLKWQVEAYITESGWPAKQPGATIVASDTKGPHR